MTTHTPIELEIPRRLADANLAPRGRVFPSPSQWRDQIFYRLLPDRFSDGREDTCPLFDPNHSNQFKAPNKAMWMAAGNRFVGGTLKGVEDVREDGFGGGSSGSSLPYCYSWRRSLPPWASLGIPRRP